MRASRNGRRYWSKRDLHNRARIAESYLETTRRQLDVTLGRVAEERERSDDYLRELVTAGDRVMQLTAEVDTLSAIVNDLREQLTAEKRRGVSLEKKNKTRRQETT